MVKFDNDWDRVLQKEFEKDYYIQLREFLKKEYSTKTIYPDMNDIFNALKHTAFGDVKVVILGQDPYHEPNQAHGLSFSVKKGVRVPPSLVNIYKELNQDIAFEIPNHGCLMEWADRGVLLLNTVLTVERGKANSHKGKGWETFTDNIIKKLNDRKESIVFILWGTNARSKKNLITNGKHHIIESVHPSPLSAYKGFFGGKYFSKANSFLDKPLDWSLKVDI